MKTSGFITENFVGEVCFRRFRGFGAIFRWWKLVAGYCDSWCLPWVMITRRSMAELRGTAHASRLLLAAGPRLRAHTACAPRRRPPSPPPRMIRQPATRCASTVIHLFVSDLIVTLSTD